MKYNASFDLWCWALGVEQIDDAQMNRRKGKSNYREKHFNTL